MNMVLFSSKPHCFHIQQQQQQSLCFFQSSKTLNFRRSICMFAAKKTSVISQFDSTSKVVNGALSSDNDSTFLDRQKALEAAMNDINNSFGKGSVTRLGSLGGALVETFPSGCLPLDLALGGGLPKGRIVEIYGPESSGKTTLALHAIAEVQKLGGNAMLVDAEHAFDPSYSKALGVDVENLIVCQPDNGEMALEIADRMCRSGAVDLICIDSVSALTPRAEIEGEIGMQQMGLQARLMSQALRKMSGNALHLLSTILSSVYSAPVHENLCTMSNLIWTAYVRVGVVAILQNRVAPNQRFEALTLAESVMCIAGERWLIEQRNLPDSQDSIPADRCTLLVLETSRVEIAVLLNDLAYLKYEKSDSLDVETFSSKQRNLGIAFSLVEKIIKVISSVAEDEGNIISDKTFTKIITGLNETVGVILEYLRDAKDHGQHKGNDLLASVRIVGSYLAETPAACNDKIIELLGYMVSVQGEDEQSPFSSVCFLLPMLCQITMESDGCRLFISSEAYKAVIECLIKLLSKDTGTFEENGPVFLACDTISNLLLKIGVYYGNPEVTSGGIALKFFASVRLEIRPIGKIKSVKGDEDVGLKVRVRVQKSKVSRPYKLAEFEIIFGEGASKLGCILDCAEMMDIVLKKGSWYSFGDQRLGQGRDRSLQFLRENLPLCDEIEKMVRSAMVDGTGQAVTSYARHSTPEEDELLEELQ